VDDRRAGFEFLEQPGQIVGHRGFELQALASPRGVELQAVRVERHPRDQRRWLPVREIADERVALGC
jgi:hypothetical protein